MYGPRLLHPSSLKGHSGCFRVSATVNKAAVTSGYMYLRGSMFSDFSGSCLEERLLDHSSSVLNFRGPSILFPIVAAQTCILTSGVRGVLLPHSLSGTAVTCLVGDSHRNV